MRHLHPSVPLFHSVRSTSPGGEGFAGRIGGGGPAMSLRGGETFSVVP